MSGASTKAAKQNHVFCHAVCLARALTRVRSAALAVLIFVGVSVVVGLEPSMAGPRILANLVHIADGDTFWAEIAVPGAGLAAREKVRLVGIDCPETDQVPWGAQATARLTALVLGQPIQIEIALQSRDRYGRLLASIWRDGLLVQEPLVREGLCVAYTVPPNVEYVDRIRMAAEQARRDGLGIYAPERPLLEFAREHRQRRSGLDPA
jgi:micrococcal nuclease